MRPLLTRLWRDARGIAATEFALILPILVLFSAGTIEYSRLILLDPEAAERLVHPRRPHRPRQDADRGPARQHLPRHRQRRAALHLRHDGKAIVTSIGVDAAKKPIVNWQRAGAGTLAATSAIGSAGGTATLPADLTIASGETIISAEVYFSFQPLFGIGLAPQVIRRVAYYKPRLGSLDTLLP